MNVEQLERLVHERVNQVRAEHGLEALQWSVPLRRLADGHSRDMAEQDFFAHVNPQRQDVDARAQAAGMAACTIPFTSETWAVGFGENLYAATRYINYRVRYNAEGRETGRSYRWKSEAAIARETVQQWMDSPGHRVNVLSPYHRTQAIGIALRKDRFFVTQVLC